MRKNDTQAENQKQALQDPRIERLCDPHVRPLTELIVRWQETTGLNFPWVDPDDGGVNAKVLFLQHTPGRMAVRSGFVSRSNPDRTAKNAGAALDHAGFARCEYVRWNVVPYYISTADKDGKATKRQVCEAATYTQEFIDRLPNLRVVVFCGRKAQIAIPHLKLPAGVEALETFHCGGQSFDARPKQKAHILETYRTAYRLMAEDR